MRRTIKRKYPKLRGRVKTLASRYIAEEVRTHKYPLVQARAIGISRAKHEVQDSLTMTRLKRVLAKYK